MSQLIRISQPIIVEGKYDKITLENVVDGLIIPTNGFGIFKDKKNCRMISRLAQKNGIIIMTDSDSAGALIRAYIKKIVGDAPIYNAYIPCLKGKEKRKAQHSREGFLGVEGMTTDIIKLSLERCGVMTENSACERKITKADMFEFGLSGGTESSVNRKKVLKFLDLPQTLSPNAMLDVLNNMLTYEEFTEVIKRCQEAETKN